MAATSILHIVNGEEYSGLERVVDQLVRAAADFGYNVHIALLKPGRMVERMKARCATVHALPMRHRADLSVARRVSELVAEHRYSLIHSHTVRSALIAACVKRPTNVPWIHHLHGSALHESHRIASNLRNFAAEGLLLGKVDQVVAVSDALAEYAVRYYRLPRSRISVVPNGVERNFSVDHLELTAADRQTVSVIGLFRPRKGISVLIDAVTALINSGQRLDLRVVGEFADGDYQTQIKEQIRQRGLSDVVQLIGFTNDLTAEFGRCSVFAFPSLYHEGTPMALLEAMAAGRPVVGSDVPGVREVLENGGGILVPPGNAALLAQGIGRLMNDPAFALSLGAEGRRRQLARYSAAAMCNSIYGIYDRVARKTV